MTYTWPLDIEETEETDIEHPISINVTGMKCPTCDKDIEIDEFPRMLYPPEVLITTHSYDENELNGENTIGSLRFPEYLDLTDLMEPDGDMDDDDDEEGEEGEREKIYRLQAVISCNWVDAGAESGFSKEYCTQLRRKEGKWTRIQAPGHERIDSHDVSFKDVVYYDEFRLLMLFWVRDRAARKSDLARCNKECAVDAQDAGKDTDKTATEEIMDDDCLSSDGEPEFNESLNI